MTDKSITYEMVKSKALRLLEFRNHSEYELRQKLSAFGADDEAIERVMSFVSEYSLINDAEYAKGLAKDYRSLKKFGVRRIKSELYKKGISQEDIEAAVAALEPIDEAQSLKPLLKKRLSGDFEKRNIDKNTRYFINRGYSFDDIRLALEEIKAEEIQ